MKTKSFNDAFKDDLNDPEFARGLLNDILAEGDMPTFLVTLRNLAQARADFKTFAREAQVSREALYRALSAKGNPRLDTLVSALDALGFRLAVTPKERAQIEAAASQEAAA